MVALKLAAFTVLFLVLFPVTLIGFCCLVQAVGVLWNKWQLKREQNSAKVREEVAKAFQAGYQKAIGDYAKAKKVTKDRPKDWYMEDARREIEKMTGGAA